MNAIHERASAGRSSAVDLAMLQIRSLIRERSLIVGDGLPSEVELAGMFGASRNTIREAVRTLKAYGVVESRQKVGAILIDNRRAAMTDLLSTAMEVSADTFRDIQGFRRLTEMNLGETIVGRLSDACLAQMARANRAMEETDNPLEASELDFRFHMLLVESAGNRTLAEIYGMLKPVIRRLMEAGKSQRAALHAAAAEHDNILQALKQGDRIGFTYHMDRHLDAGLQFIPASGAHGEADHVGDAAYDEIEIARILEASGQPIRHANTFFHVAQRKNASIRRDRPTVEPRHDRLAPGR